MPVEPNFKAKIQTSQRSFTVEIEYYVGRGLA